MLLTCEHVFNPRQNGDNVEAVNAGPQKTKELIDIIEEDRALIAGDTVSAKPFQLFQCRYYYL